MDTMTAALLRERDEYVAKGQADRVALVEEQLRLRGHAVEPARPVVDEPGPRARQAPKKRTA